MTWLGRLVPRGNVAASSGRGIVNEGMSIQAHWMWFRTVDLMGDPGEFEISPGGVSRER